MPMARAWSLFELVVRNPAQTSGARLLFLPPTLAQTIDGEPIEQVALFRDEMANMAWGVERRVQGVSGDGVRSWTEASGAPRSSR